MDEGRIRRLALRMAVEDGGAPAAFANLEAVGADAGVTDDEQTWYMKETFRFDAARCLGDRLYEALGQDSPAGADDPFWKQVEDRSLSLPVTVKATASYPRDFGEIDWFIEKWDEPYYWESHDPYEPDSESDGEVYYHPFSGFLKVNDHFMESLDAEAEFDWDERVKSCLVRMGRVEFDGTPFAYENGRIVISDENGLISQFGKAYEKFTYWFDDNETGEFFDGIVDSYGGPDPDEYGPSGREYGPYEPWQ